MGSFVTPFLRMTGRGEYAPTPPPAVILRSAATKNLYPNSKQSLGYSAYEQPGIKYAQTPA